MGTPSYGYSARVPFRGPWLLWVRRSTAERPSPLRVCSDLHNNALTGRVPSSLSALINLSALCAPPCCRRRLRVRPSRVGWVGSAPRARHVGGGACLGRGDAAAGPVAGLLEGTSGMRCD
jgi:hypothetical protein